LRSSQNAKIAKSRGESAKFGYGGPLVIAVTLSQIVRGREERLA
jgi:hypothetical protein